MLDGKMIRTPLLRVDNGRARVTSITRVALCLWIAQTLAACDVNESVEIRNPASSPGGVTVPPQPVRLRLPLTGFFRGGAAIGESTYYVDALITADGGVRIHVAGPFDEKTVFSGNGFPVSADIAESVQLVGHIDTIGGLGEGVVLGQACAPSDPGRFCDVPAPASISIAWQPWLPFAVPPQSQSEVAGEVRVTTSAGEEIWHLDVSKFYSVDPQTTDTAGGYAGPTGVYREELALFAETGEVVVTIDSLGRLFFQSPESGCIGNGTLRPRPDGVFDAGVLIENCGEGYAFLNGEYQGLAIETPTCAGTPVLMFLSVPEGLVPRRAITMLGIGIGPPLPCDEGWW